MSMPNRAGKFVADVTDRSFTEQGPNTLPCVLLRLALTHEFIKGEWDDCGEEQLEITSYNYLQKRDGTINEFAIKALKEALGWDGVDLAWIGNNEIPVPQVQVELGWDIYEGQERIRVKYMNKLGSSGGGGGIPEFDPALLTSPKMKSLMRDLRAFSGGTARKPVAPPANKPKSPPTRPSVPSAPQSTAEEVWEYFADGCEKAGIADIETKWWALLKNVTGKNDPDAITGEEWGKVKTVAKTTILVSGEDIPF